MLVGPINKDLRINHLREVSTHMCLMLLAFAVTLAVAPDSSDEFPFDSAQEFIEFKTSSQKQFMDCTWETLETENWVRRLPVCHFGGYRPNGPESAL